MIAREQNLMAHYQRGDISFAVSFFWVTHAQNGVSTVSPVALPLLMRVLGAQSFHGILMGVPCAPVKRILLIVWRESEKN